MVIFGVNGLKQAEKLVVVEIRALLTARMAEDQVAEFHVASPYKEHNLHHAPSFSSAEASGFRLCGQTS